MNVMRAWRDRWAYRLYPKSFGPKVFCIGYNKTGTTALGQALKSLGYRHTSYNHLVWEQWYKQGQVARVLHYMAHFDSADDLPWLKQELIPLLDERFPGSKFVYLERAEEAWLASLKAWAAKTGRAVLSDTAALTQYRNHRKFVLGYFEGRAKDLLRLEIMDPQGMEKLAAFLGRVAARADFAQYNKT